MNEKTRRWFPPWLAHLIPQPRHLRLLPRALVNFAHDYWSGLVQFLKTEDRLHLTLLGVVLLLALIVRLAFINQPMRTDESMSFTYAVEPLPKIVSTFATNNHFLNSVLMHWSIQWFGIEPWALRLPVFIAGILFIPVVYGVTRALYNRDIALLTTALTAVSVPFILYSTNARAYMFVNLFTLLLLALALRLRAGYRRSPVQDDTLAWGLFALFSALGLWANTSITFPALMVGLWMLSDSLQVDSAHQRSLFVRNLGWTFLLTMGFTIIFYSPAFARSGIEYLWNNETTSARTWSNWFAGVVRVAPGMWWSWHLPLPLLLSPLIPIVAALGTWWHRRVGRYPLPLLPLAAGIAVVFTLLLRPEFYARFYLYVLPPYLMAVAAGIWLLSPSSFRIHRLPMAGVVVAVLAGGIIMHQQIVSNEIRETGTLAGAQAALAYVKPLLKPDTRLLAYGSAGGAITNYYLELLDIPPRYLTLDFESGVAHVVLLVNTRRDTLGDVMTASADDLRDFGEPYFLQIMGDVAVYQADRPPP